MQQVQMQNELKTDEEYGYRISLQDDRNFSTGHRIHTLGMGETEVNMLRAIMDLYIPTDSPEMLETFTDHKMDFSVNVLDTLFMICKQKFDYANALMAELDKQETDIAHKILKPALMGQSLTKEEKIQVYDEQEKLFVQRRRIKDAVLVLNVMMQGMENMRNYILGMNKRKFVPASNKYKEMSEFKINSPSSRVTNKS